MIKQLDTQLDLFPENWQQVEKEHQVSIHHAGVLYKEKLLSFNPEEKEQLYWFEIAELIFLKVLFFDTGLPKVIAKSIVENLEKPYRYSLNDIYWDFQKKEWKSFEDKIEENKETWINEEFPDLIYQYIDDCEDIDIIREIRNRIDNRIDEFVDNQFTKKL